MTDLRGSQGPFTNIQGGYWSGTEFHTGGAWGFNFANGSQGLVSQGVLFAAWAVRPGDVASVPEPGAWLLMGVGFVGLVAARGWWGR